MEFKIKSILYVISSTYKREFYQDMFFGHLSYDSEDFNTSLNTRRSKMLLFSVLNEKQYNFFIFLS